MRRRDLLKAAGASLAALAAPRIGQAEKASKLVFVPPADLSLLDPVATFFRPTRNHAYLVFDTLYGIDTNWATQPQMVEGHQVDEDGLTWTLTLRDGLRFHDKEPVLARDVVASIRRFAQRISFANALMAATDELSAPDDRAVRFRLKRPFPHLPEALAGPGGTVPAIMPERLAATSPYEPVAEIVGSGPYRFLPDEYVSGARAAYSRFTLYQPRASGPVGFTSGPKITHFDRVEWLTLDPFSAMAALRAGEVDWWEAPGRDLVEAIARDRNVTVISQYATAIGLLRFNHLHPPFDNAAVRRALLGAVDQAEAMTAAAGTDRAFWHDRIGLFGTGTPLANEAGIEALGRPRDYPAARQALADAGYNGEKIVVLAPTELGAIRAISLVGVDQLRRAGINVDLQEMELGNVVRRRLNRSAPDKGGWNAFFFLVDRSLPNTNPYGNPWIRADGLGAFDGWPTSERIEALRAAWLDAASLEEQRRICTELQMQLWQVCPTFRWANIGNRPPIARTCSMCCLAASRSFGVFAEHKETGRRSSCADGICSKPPAWVLPRLLRRGSDGRKRPINWFLFPPKISTCSIRSLAAPLDAQLRLSRLRYALWDRYQLGGAASDGRGTSGRGGWADLDSEIARRAALSRQRAGAGARRRRQHPPLCCPHQPCRGADGRDRGIVGARRPHRAVPSETAVSASAGGAGGTGRQCPRDHAGAAGGDLAVQAGCRDHRQRALSLPARRAYQRRPHRLRALPALPAAHRRTSGLYLRAEDCAF